MTYFTKYHLREQQAYALLGPICATLRELEQRTQHYVDRVAMEPADVAAVQAASHAIAVARAEVERLWQTNAPQREEHGRHG